MMRHISQPKDEAIDAPANLLYFELSKLPTNPPMELLIRRQLCPSIDEKLLWSIHQDFAASLLAKC